MIEKLLKKEPYLPEFKKLRDKLNSGKLRLTDYELTESITLAWTLYNEDFVISELIKDLKAKRYETPYALEKRVSIDGKDRLIYAFDWHEKILQGVAAGLLSSVIEPEMSGSLHSYRKGRGSHNTLMSLSNYIRSFSEDQSLYVIKRDIKSYGDNIPHDQLFEVLEKYVPKNDYLFEVIRKMIEFKYYDHSTKELKQKDKGLPTGAPLNNVIVNMFLMDMDKRIDKYGSKSSYFRYGDDILTVTPDKSTAEEIRKVLQDFISSKELSFHEEKMADITFDRTSLRDESFKYLGLMVRPDGELALTKEKDKKIKDQIKQTILKINRMSVKVTKDKEKRIKSLISSVRSLFYKTDLMIQLSSYFPIVNDEDYWQELDLWTAKLLLGCAYDQKSEKVFQRYPFKKLRQKGLPSIRHLRRLYLDDKKRFFEYINIEPK